MAVPTWLGQPSSVAKVALERMDALLSETCEDGRTPIAHNRVAGVVRVGNEDGAHLGGAPADARLARVIRTKTLGVPPSEKRVARRRRSRTSAPCTRS